MLHGELDPIILNLTAAIMTILVRTPVKPADIDSTEVSSAVQAE